MTPDNARNDSASAPEEVYQAALAPPARPASALIFGILNVAFGGIAIPSVAASAVVMLAPQDERFPNPAIEAMRDNPAFREYSIVSLALGFAAAVALVAAGIGLVRFKSWGRTLSIVYAIFAIVFGIVNAVVNFFVLLQPELARLGGAPIKTEQTIALATAIGGVFGGCFGVVYPILLLIFMLRPRLAAAFREAKQFSAAERSAL